MIPQSATSISDFKSCPTLFYLRHVLRLRPVETPEAARQGTNWHKCLEILTMEPGSFCPDCKNDAQRILELQKTDCPICEKTGIVPQDLRSALIRYMNQVYENCPPSVELTDWEIERTILLYSALGWQWYYQNDEIRTLAREVPFKRQVNNAYSRRGKIDRIIRREKRLCLGEYKSTSKPIDSGSLYWDRLRLDSQPTLYLIEARHAQLTGQLAEYGILATDPPISGVLYDVWHKPTIRPKKLSQADTKKFIKDGEYFGEKFEVQWAGEAKETPAVSVNCIEAEVTLGALARPTKKNPDPIHPVSIRETPEMFGARLLAGIREQPEKYFARKEIVRTDQELERLDREFYNLARIADFMTKRDLWFVNEHHCDVTYRCAFHSICYYNQDVSDGKVPDGFKCLNKDKK